MSTTSPNMKLTIPQTSDTVSKTIADLAADLNKLDQMWPVGSVFLNVDGRNPSTFLGGTWAQVAQGRCIIGQDGSHGGGKAGGSMSRTLGVANMPAHSHSATTSSNGGHSHSATTSWNGDHTHKTWYLGIWPNDNHTYGQTQLDKFWGDMATVPSGSYIEYGRGYAFGPSAGGHNHTLTTSSAGGHTHTLTTNSVGSNQAFSVEPAWFGVYVWQRTA